jgi:uncharacterized membrane protein YkvA (DUF1232 family)
VGFTRNIPFRFLGLHRAFARPNNWTMFDQLRSRARALKTETYALYLASLDGRTPWFAKVLILLVVAYALSPIDLIPDFIPVVGYLDDLVIVPGGIALALRLIPAQVMIDARAAAHGQLASSRMRYMGAAIVVVIWIVAIIMVVLFLRRLFVAET